MGAYVAPFLRSCSLFDIVSLSPFPSHPLMKMASGIERSSTRRQSRCYPRRKASRAALSTPALKSTKFAEISRRRAVHRQHCIDEEVTKQATSDNEPAAQTCIQLKHTKVAKSVQRPLFDLTVETEHCTLCSNVLGEGPVYVRRMFVFKDCGCVCSS